MIGKRLINKFLKRDGKKTAAKKKPPLQPQEKSRKPDEGKDSVITSEFASLELPEKVFQGIIDAGFLEMTPIQKRSLPVTLTGADLAGQAQTGTGKTAAFLITLFAKMPKRENEKHRHPRALILAPTRELALQIFREAKKLGAHTGLKMVAVYGGEGFNKQEKLLRSGVDIVVGTPGRLLDFARRRVLILKHAEFLVIDEADRLMDMGFWEELRSILRLLPRPEKRQSMLFSATLDHRTRRIGAQYMNKPQDIIVKPESIAADGIDQMVYHVEREMKFPLLLGILEKEEIPKGLIFTNMKITAAWVVKKLHQHGFESELLTGDLRQTVRNRVLQKFQNDQVPLLVASDVASRGLHIDDVSHIINYDVPQDPEDYVHRIGRTARAGKKGKAYTLACDQYCWALPDIETLLSNPIPSTVPYDEDYGEDKTPDYSVREMERRERRKKHRSDHNRPKGKGRGGKYSGQRKGNNSRKKHSKGKSNHKGPSPGKSGSQQRSGPKSGGKKQGPPKGGSHKRRSGSPPKR